MASSFKDRVIIGNRSYASSLAIWTALSLFVLTLFLAAWASLSSGSSVPGPGEFIPSPTATPGPGVTPNPTDSPNGGSLVNNVPGLAADEEIPASEALKPFFGDGLPNIALLVSAAGSPTEREARWISDIEFELGMVQAVNYSDASYEVLSDYLTLFIIDSSNDFDPEVLPILSERGVSIHLVGDGSVYADSLEMSVGAE